MAGENGMTANGGPDGGWRTLERPQRPRELQDSLNFYLYHPLAWQLARVLARTPITPNMVSVIGGCFVVAAGIAYAQPWWPTAALLGMLNSCASNVTVVNIDNGFGAGYVASMINRL